MTKNLRRAVLSIIAAALLLFCGMQASAEQASPEQALIIAEKALDSIDPEIDRLQSFWTEKSEGGDMTMSQNEFRTTVSNLVDEIRKKLNEVRAIIEPLDAEFLNEALLCTDDQSCGDAMEKLAIYLQLKKSYYARISDAEGLLTLSWFELELERRDE